MAPASPNGAVGLVLASGHAVVLFVSCVSALFGTAAHLIRSVHTCAVGPIILELPSLLLLFSLPCGFYLPPFGPIWPAGLAPFLLLLFSLPCGFYLQPFAPIWPMGLAPFLLVLFCLLVVALTCHHSRLFGPWGWRLSFSCSSPCLLWLLFATTRAYLAHGAGAFPSPALLPACCGFYLPPFAPIWPMGLAPFLLMFFSLLVVAFYLPPFVPIRPMGLAPFLLLLFSVPVVVFTWHHSRLFGPWGCRLSFSCFSPCLLWLFTTICAYLAHWAGAFPSHALLFFLWLLLATICAYLAHWAGVFLSPAFLPSCCGFCLPPLAPIWPTGLAPFLLLLFPCLVAFTCHDLRLFGPWGWRLSFSCFSPCLLWL